MAKVTQNGYKKWMPHNIEVLKKKCRYHIQNVAEPQLVEMLKEVAQKVVNEIDTITSIPQYTGNLRDSHGVGVYINGSLSSYIPTKVATKPQRYGGHGRNEINIWGNEYLSQALKDATTDFSEGIWIVLFAAVPYAFFINENHSKAGFFDDIADTIVNEVRNGLTRLNAKDVPNILRYEQL